MTIKTVLLDTKKVISDTVKVLKEHPEVAVYPYAAALFVSVTYPLISTTLFARWYGRAFYETSIYVPHKAALILGIVSFSVFYAALVGAYFSCAVAIGVIAKLEGRHTPPLYGLLRVARHFFRVTRFAVISLLFFPIGIYVQRKKLPESWISVLGSSFTLHMAQVAPAVLTTTKPVEETVSYSIDTLGKAWHQGLTLKIGMYLVVFLLIVLPKLIQHGLFSGHSSFGWILSLEIGASGLVGIKVLNSIFTAVIYHHARQIRS